MADRIINILSAVPATGRSYRVPVEDCRNHELHLWRVIPGEWIYPHIHPRSDDIWYVVQGEGQYYTTADEFHSVGPGDLAFASPDEVHGIYNHGVEELIILSVLAPLPVEYGEAPGFAYPAWPPST